MSQSRVWRSRSDLSCHQFSCTLGILEESRASPPPPSSLYDGPNAVLLVMCQECPGHSGIFIGSGDGGAVLSPSGDQCSKPPTLIIWLRLNPAERGPGSVDEEFTKIAIPAFTDPEEPWLAPRGVFTRDQSQPGRQLAAVLELGHVTDRGDERCSTHRPEPWDGLQSLALGMGLPNAGQFLVVRHQPFFERQKLLVELPEHLDAEWGEFGLFSLELLHD